MQNDYLITIFARDKGSTRTFGLDRRLVYFLLIMLILLALSCIFFGQAYFQERKDNKRLEGRVTLLEQRMSKLRDRSQRQGGEALSGGEGGLEVQRPEIKVELRREEREATAESGDSGIRDSDEVLSDAKSVEPRARIEEARVTFLGGGGVGFLLDFKLVNLIGEPISGNVAIIASLKPPHKPQFVSFPSMVLLDGMPVKLRKSVGFDIRYYKTVSGKFYYPFSYSESFRILVYDSNEELILDSTLPVKEVEVYGRLSTEYASPSGSS